MLVTGTGGRRFSGIPDQPSSSAGAFGWRSAALDATMLKSPAKGAGMPPTDSPGDPPLRSASDLFASSALIGVGLLPPSMNTSPASPCAPGLPPKFHVAYAEAIEPPSE